MKEIFRIKSKRSIPPWHAFISALFNPWIIIITALFSFLLYILSTWFILPTYYELLNQPTIQTALSLLFLLIPFVLASLWLLIIIALIIKIIQNIFNLEDIEYIGTSKHLEFISKGNTYEKIQWKHIQDNIKIINSKTIELTKAKANIVTSYTRSGEVLKIPVFMKRYITNIPDVNKLKEVIEKLIK